MYKQLLLSGDSEPSIANVDEILADPIVWMDSADEQMWSDHHILHVLRMAKKVTKYPDRVHVINVYAWLNVAKHATNRNLQQECRCVADHTPTYEFASDDYT